jgi:transposase
VYLSIGQGYRDKDGKVKSKTVKSLGYVDELEAQYPNPVEHFAGEVERMNDEARRERTPETVRFDMREMLEIGESERNIGYAALSKLYYELEIDTFLSNHHRSSKAEYDLNSIMKLLVYSRILSPGSKKAAYEGRGRYFDKMEFSLDDVYRALTELAKMKDGMLAWMHERVLRSYGSDTTLVYYDVTNYYFEIDEEDDMRRNGVRNEHRPNPIVQMGLFMDSGGIPMAYSLFPGNCNDCLTLAPIMGSVRKKFNPGKMVVVADKGMNTADNVYYIANRGWYIFSQRVRGGTKELRGYVLNESGYVWDGPDFKKKSRQFTRRVEVSVPDGNGGTKTVRAEIAEKQIAIYSRDYDKKAKRDREKALGKARDIVRSPEGYNKYNTHGAAKYIKHLEFDAGSGEIIKTKSVIQFDEERLAEEEKYDGYCLIVTNGYDQDDGWALDKYKGLWEIEETFRVTKSDLEARPVYVSRSDHIEAHFLTCFVALLITRLLQKRLGRKHSPARLIESLARACCARIDTNRFMCFHYDEVLEDVGAELKIDFCTKYRTLLDIRKLIGATKKGG